MPNQRICYEARKELGYFCCVCTPNLSMAPVPCHEIIMVKLRHVPCKENDMPRFSICVSSYKDEKYLPACIDSVLAQSFTDLELIVVDDGSPDSTASILEQYAQKDSRVIPLIQDKNRGLHIGRKIAVEKSTGDYIILLDSDDELGDDCLAKFDSYLNATPCDVLHFGIDVINVGVSNNEASNFQNYINAPVNPLFNKDIFEAVFSAHKGYLQDWRITQRVYAGGFFRRMFATMTNDRLERAEDAYESFVTLANARSQYTANDIVGVRYYLGRGVNSDSSLSVSAFFKSASDFQANVDHMRTFADAFDAFGIKKTCSDAVAKMYELLFNDWLVRVPEDQKLDAADEAAKVMGKLPVAEELMRLSRDRAYSLLQTNCAPINDMALDWYEHAKKLASTDAATSPRFMAFYTAARDHVNDLVNMAKRKSYENLNIRIFVSAHKPVELFDSSTLQPVQVGCSLRNDRFPWAFHDDKGNNISDLNPMYCELTTQYWAWKNTSSEYVGFCHYRRYFDFSNTRHSENIYGEIMDDFIDAASQKKYSLDDESIEKFVTQYDVVTTERKDIRTYAGRNATMRSQYDAADKLFVEDLDKVISILKLQHPEYGQDADKFLSGHVGRFCNMFIMKRDIFNDYCAWLFPLLEEFVSTTDMSHYSKEGVRTPGHLAERLLNIYLIHHERMGAGWKMAELQCVHFRWPDRRASFTAPYGEADSKQIIPVVFAADNNYVPMLTTTVYSTLLNASKDYFYDVVVLHRDITGDNQLTMQRFFGQFENMSLRFCDVSEYVLRHDLSTNNPHISVETYYRFLIQEILPDYDKVLYLDSDLIIQGDISELYGVNLGNNLLAATHDIDFLGNLNMKNGKRLTYAKKVLGMKNPYDYFQAGVLVLNTAEMRKLYSIEAWLDFASDDRFIYNDQDVLNAHCEGRVTWLDNDWNVMIDCNNRIANVFSFAPASTFDAFNDSRNHEKIIHYAGFEKPWKFSSCDRSIAYWTYARQTPFYESLMSMLAGPVRSTSSSPLTMHEHAISPDNPLRKFIDPIAPVGSVRREMLKSAARAVRKKK